MKIFERDESPLKILKKGRAVRVLFFYPGDDLTYVENVNVTLYTNGIILIESPNEVTTAHLNNCEILWEFHLKDDHPTDHKSKVRYLRPKETTPRTPPPTLNP